MAHYCLYMKKEAITNALPTAVIMEALSENNSIVTVVGTEYGVT